MLIDQCLAQPSSVTLPPAADGNKYRDPQPDNMQRVRDLGTLSPKSDCFHQSSLPLWRREPYRRGRQGCKNQRVGRTPKYEGLLW